MGNAKFYKVEGGFTQYLYEQVGETLNINGMRIKAIVIKDSKDTHSGLPIYSNTSDVYIKIGRKSHQPEAIRIYENRKAVLDIDWGHAHGGFKENEAHVHSINDNFIRSTKRHLTTEEIAKYGSILKMINPKIILKTN